MEYVGGQSLKQILTARREANAGHSDPLPASQAIAYMLEILPAIGHLHDIGLLFCDFKLDNVIQTQHSLKLIDLGGVYRIEEPGSAVFGTVGYQAPEIAAAGPSIASDLFTVAGTLAVLCLDLRGYQRQYRFTLPPRGAQALIRRDGSLHRLLLKGTASDPDDRFRPPRSSPRSCAVSCEKIVADEQGRPSRGEHDIHIRAARRSRAARLARSAASAGVCRRSRRRISVRADGDRAGAADRTASGRADPYGRGRAATRRRS
jgi:serine/threonine-protein kinase PknG